MGIDFEDEQFEGFVPDEGTFKVEVDADLESDGPPDDDGPPPDPQAPRLTRDQKKGARYDELVAAKEKAEREAELLRQENLRYQSHWQTQQQFAPPQQSQPQADPEETRITDELSQLDKRREEVQRLYQAEHSTGKMTPERHAELNRRYEELGEKKAELRIDLRDLKRRPSQQQIAQMQEVEYVRANWPDIAADRDMYNYASSLVFQERTLRQKKGDARPFTKEDFDRIAERARVDLGVKPPPVSDATRLRFSGHSVGSNGGGEPTSDFPQTLTKDEMRMAVRTYPELSKKQAAAKFYREVKLPGLKEDAAARRASG